MAAAAAQTAQGALDKLERDEAARAARVKQQRQAEVAARDPTEDVDAFLKVFEAEFTAIKQATADAADGDQSADVDAAKVHFDALAERCAKLNETLSSAAVFLPAYTFRQRQTDLSSLVGDVSIARNKVAPKKKFSFKDRKKRAPAGGASSVSANAPAAPQPAAEADAAVPSPHVPPEVLRVVQENGTHSGDVRLSPDAVQENFDPAYLISNSTNISVIKRAGAISGHDYAVADLADSVIYLLDVVGALYIQRVQRCRIVVGCVKGSVHINDAVDCSISLCARQVRIHKTFRTKFHIFCASDPIIEHCDGLHFGSYEHSYPDFESHMQQSQLAGLKDSTQNVQDFQWLKRAQSPHWCRMDEAMSNAEIELRLADQAQLDAA